MEADTPTLRRQFGLRRIFVLMMCIGLFVRLAISLPHVAIFIGVLLATIFVTVYWWRRKLGPLRVSLLLVGWFAFYLASIGPALLLYRWWGEPKAYGDAVAAFYKPLSDYCWEARPGAVSLLWYANEFRYGTRWEEAAEHYSIAN